MSITSLKSIQLGIRVKRQTDSSYKGDSRQSRLSKKPFSSWLPTKFSVSRTRSTYKHQMPIATACKPLKPYKRKAEKPRENNVPVFNADL